MIYLLTVVFMHVHTLLCFLIFSFSSLVNRAQDTQQSLTVAILAGCAIGLVVFSSATMVIIITR